MNDALLTSLLGKLGVSDAELLADKSLVHGNMIYRARRGDDRCVVKYSETDPASIENEYVNAKRFFEASNGMAPEMLGFVRQDGAAACAMRWVEGRPLMQAMAVRDMAAQERMADQVLGLLRLFRTIGFAHRDFFWNNILVTPGDRIVLIDFQNSVFIDQDEDPFAWSLAHIRSFIYKFRDRGRPVGVFNDTAKILALAKDECLFDRLMVARLTALSAEFDFYCPIGPAKAASYLFGVIGVVVKFWTAKAFSEPSKKLQMKYASIAETLPFWIRHGVRGRRRFLR